MLAELSFDDQIREDCRNELRDRWRYDYTVNRDGEKLDHAYFRSLDPTFLEGLEAQVGALYSVSLFLEDEGGICIEYSFNKDPISIRRLTRNEKESLGKDRYDLEGDLEYRIETAREEIKRIKTRHGNILRHLRDEVELDAPTYRRDSNQPTRTVQEMREDLAALESEYIEETFGSLSDYEEMINSNRIDWSDPDELEDFPTENDTDFYESEMRNMSVVLLLSDRISSQDSLKYGLSKDEGATAIEFDLDEQPICCRRLIDYVVDEKTGSEWDARFNNGDEPKEVIQKFLRGEHIEVSPFEERESRPPAQKNHAGFASFLYDSLERENKKRREESQKKKSYPAKHGSAADDQLLLDMMKK